MEENPIFTPTRRTHKTAPPTPPLPDCTSRKIKERIPEDPAKEMFILNVPAAAEPHLVDGVGVVVVVGGGSRERTQNSMQARLH